eukprot:Sspe_Gene.46354::Locus_23147_Transcript_4_6_Confidence_0.571_Length_521::g.46354::m.46354
MGLPPRNGVQSMPQRVVGPPFLCSTVYASSSGRHQSPPTWQPHNEEARSAAAFWNPPRLGMAQRDGPATSSSTTSTPRYPEPPRNSTGPYSPLSVPPNPSIFIGQSETSPIHTARKEVVAKNHDVPRIAAKPAAKPPPGKRTHNILVLG